MVTSTTIEATTALFLNTTDTSSASSYATKSSGFENVFENANKAYDGGQSDKVDSSYATSQTTTAKKTEPKSSNTESPKKVEETSPEIKDKTVEAKENGNDLDVKKVDKEPRTGEAGDAQDTEETEPTTGEAKKIETTENVTPTEEIKSLEVQIPDNTQQAVNLPTDAYQATVLTNNMIESFEQAAASKIATTPDTITQVATTTIGEVTGGAATIQEPVINSNLTQMLQGQSNNAETKLVDNSATIQTQSAKAETQNVQIQDLKTAAQQVEQAQQTQQTQQAIHVPTEATLQANVHSQIAANTAIKTEAKVSTDENTATQNKTVLTQEMIDKTNAKIQNVESNAPHSSGSNNLLNKQNAQEQAIKFSLESKNSSAPATNSSINPALAGISDATAQVNFSKTLDNIQTQAPKEISNTDLLAQINKQLDGLKEEGTTKVTIILRPENLGKINLELVNGKDGLTARMTTDSPQVKELLDKSLNNLKETIGNQGVNVNNVSVKLNETQKQDNNFLFNGQTGQEQQQQSSHNSKQTQENEFSFNKELNSATENESEGTESISTTGRTESTVSVGSHLGQVDYKV